MYLYAHNPSKGYGAPSEVTYNVPQPKKPSQVQAVGSMNDIGVSTETIPVGCKGMNVYVGSKVYFTPNNVISIPLDAGVYSVSVAFTDIFGEGPRTDAIDVTVKAKIDKALLDMESLGLDAMDKAVKALQGEMGTVKTNVNGLSSRIIDQANAYQRSLSDLNKNVTSQITQISQGFELKVTQAIGKLDGKELISRINLTPAGTRIDGKLLHVTGQALFDDNIVTKKMLQAGSVSADKMQVDSLSSISANIGSLKGGSITGTTFKNANNTFRIDANGNIVGANITGSRIDAQSIYQAGFEVKNLDIQVFQVRHGDYCHVPKGYNRADCTFIPVGYNIEQKAPSREEWRREESRYNYKPTNLKIQFSKFISHKSYDHGVNAGIDYDDKCAAYSASITGGDTNYGRLVTTGIGTLFVLCIAIRR